MDDRGHLLWRRVTERAGRLPPSGWAGVVCAVAAERAGVDGAAISVRAGTRAQELAAASCPWAQRLEELQYTVGEGPGVQAFGTGAAVLVADLGTADERWPGFVAMAVEAGAAAVFGFPLHAGTVRLGTLDLYRRSRGAMTAAQLATATTLAGLAMTAVLADLGRGPVRGHGGGHYDDVNVATGMLAAQLAIPVDEAFLRLRAHAVGQGRPLLDVARDVVRHRLRFDRPAD